MTNVGIGSKTPQNRRSHPPRRPRADEVFEGGEQHLAGVAAEHFGGQPVELDAVAARGGADDRGEQRLLEAAARAAWRGGGEGFGPHLAVRLHHMPNHPPLEATSLPALQFRALATR